MSDTINYRRVLFTEIARLLFRSAGPGEFALFHASRSGHDSLSAERIASALGYVPGTHGNGGTSRSGINGSGAALVKDAVEAALNRKSPGEPGISVLTDLCRACGRKPCLERCLTGALSETEGTDITFDREKCILCGQCYIACPFDAVLNGTQIADVIGAIVRGRHLSALLSPAIEYRYPGRVEAAGSALRKIGFSDIFPLSESVHETIREETAELEKRASTDGAALTSSFCPAWSAAAEKLNPKLVPTLSTSATPMHHAARRARDRVPGTLTVFIGPCFAKKAEAYRDPEVDMVLTFEELDALFEARGIGVPDRPETPAAADAEQDGTAAYTPRAVTAETSARDRQRQDSKTGRRFDIPVSGGMTAAVMMMAGKALAYAEIVNGLSEESLAYLAGLDGGPEPGVYREVMACEGGCMYGPGMGGGEDCLRIHKRNDKGFLCRLDGGVPRDMV